jgi:RimJ/RimL family protein N-acetyltransferase
MPIPCVQHHSPITADVRTVVLSDGARAAVRTLAGGEVAVVQEVFEGMSERSRYQRFMGTKPTLSQRDLEFLTAIDHENHEAFIAVDPATGTAIGEAHLVRDREDQAVGEVAFAVTDKWQNQRLGTHLADLLAKRARELGIQRLRANMLAENSRSGALMRRMGRVVARAYEKGALELEVALD